MMKPMPGLDDLLDRAVANGVFGTKDALGHQAARRRPGRGRRSAVRGRPADPRRRASCRSSSPRSTSTARRRPRPRTSSRPPSSTALEPARRRPGRHAQADAARHRQPLRASSSRTPRCCGWSRCPAATAATRPCEKLSRNHGVIASFSRALTEGLTAQQSDEEFNATLDPAIAEHRQGIGYLTSARGHAAALLAGALPALAFPAPSWWWLAWVGLVPLLFVVRAAPTAMQGGVRAWFGMAGFVLVSQYWLGAECGAVAGRLRDRHRSAVAPMGVCGASAALRADHGATRAHRRCRTPLCLGDRRGRAVVAPSRRAVGAARRLAMESAGDARTGLTGRRLVGELPDRRCQHRGRGGDPDAVRAGGRATGCARGARPDVVLVGTDTRPGVDGPGRARPARRHRGGHAASGRE